MNQRAKTILLTTLTLMAIATSAAVLVSVTNIITSPIIARNEEKKESDGLSKVFGQEAIVNVEEAVSLEAVDYLKKYYPVSYQGNACRIYKAYGKNSYGDLELLVGVLSDYSLYNIYVLNNGQSYGSTLQEKYIVPLQESNDKESALNNVSCGATFGAKLCKTLVDASISHFQNSKEGQ